MAQDVRQKISEFNERLAGLDRQFNLYFYGLEKVPPLKEFEQFKREVTRFMQPISGVMSVSMRFIMTNFQHRFALYRAKWEKVLRDIEAGRFKPGPKS